MLKISTGKLIIALVVLLVAFIVIQYTNDSERSRGYRDVLVNIDHDKVTKIEINNPQEKVVLEEREEKWWVSDGQEEYRATEGSVNSLLNSLNTIEPSRLAARSSAKWKDFAVDSAGTRVQVFEDGEESLDIILGRFGVEGQRRFYSYVRLEEEEDVYVADNFMKMSISVDPDSYRNNVLLRIKRDSIRSIEFDYPDSAFIVSKEQGQWRSGDFKPDSTNVAQYLNKLSMLTSRNFTVQPTTSPEMEVIFKKLNDSQSVIKAYEDEEGWIINSSENPAEFFRDSVVFRKIFAGPSSLQ